MPEDTSSSELNSPESGEQQPPQMDRGAYEIIRKRLDAHGNELRRRIGLLDEARKQAFGAVESSLLGSERIVTEHNCIPRDIVAVGDRLLFGYNVHFGLSTERRLSDVFSIYQFTDSTFRERPLELIEDERFISDYKEIYRYYKNTVFAKFAVIGSHLYMEFRIGKSVKDFKAFKWFIDGDALRYIDNRSEQELRYPPQYEFEWKRAHRDMHYYGPHPHVSIEDRIFVETVGGDLTVKIENNTESGEGIYAEEVENKDQTLDDAEILYATVGNIILLKIRPYQEKDYRYLAFNDKSQEVCRLDSIEQACVLLPNNQGLIFSNGYYLQTGARKIFDNQLREMLYEKRLQSPNGEDFLYIFHNRQDGVYILLPYNIIRQQVETPVICNGYSIFADGRLICFKGNDEPRKSHAIQIWRTPYMEEGFSQAAQPDSYLAKIGNRDLVAGMSECCELLALLEKDESYRNLYNEIGKNAQDALDAHFWLASEEAFNPGEILLQIKGASIVAVGEFEKVVHAKRKAEESIEAASRRTKEVVSRLGSKRFEKISDFVESLAELRSIRGEAISLRDLRWADPFLIEKLEIEIAEYAEQTSRRCVDFLLAPHALAPYEAAAEANSGRIAELQKVSEAKVLEEQILADSGELELLVETVGNLKIDDATQRTGIVDSISAIFSKLNAARAKLKSKIRELASVEGVAEFGSRIKLLNQSVVNYLDLCDAPEKCDEYLTKLMVQMEELEGTFAEFDEFVADLAVKRDEVYAAFEQRKLDLVEKRNKRAGGLMAAAERILKGVKSRLGGLTSINDINGYFASDLMIEKVRDIIAQLGALGDSVKADDLGSRMKTVREDAVRQLKDRQELFVEGQNIIKLGRHKFSVNTQKLDLTVVPHEGRMCFHLAGTNFFEPIEDEVFLSTRDVWDQELVSETRDVYRAEFLAYRLFQSLGADELPSMDEVRQMPIDELVSLVQRFMGPRYSEGYIKGVHDRDGALLLAALADLNHSLGLLRFGAKARTLAALCWRCMEGRDKKTLLSAKLKGYGSVVELFPNARTHDKYIQELRREIKSFVEAVGVMGNSTGIGDNDLVDEAAEYLFFSLINGESFSVGAIAAGIYGDFKEHLNRDGIGASRWEKLEESLKAMDQNPLDRFSLECDWMEAFLSRDGGREKAGHSGEAAAVLHMGGLERVDVIEASPTRRIEGMTGSHGVVEKGCCILHYNEFMAKLRSHDRTAVPRYEAYQEVKKRLAAEARQALRLQEFEPRVLSSFVRNRLINDVYLHLIGDNLAKQMGVAGEDKRTDLMGLLLLISPPGYGKTTLMEYTASRLGLVFMKINGPAIGHQVTSLDPDEARNASAREELKKLNLGLEMGDNVMLYIDDIQHCNPEFLQKFISLCDAQRKIEGVWRSRPRTYDLRGKKVCVVMAGNPYTESGEKFKVPDMLANRADTYNLGEIIGDNIETFELSFLENSLTSNPALNKLASRSQKDVYSLVKAAETSSREGFEFEGNFAAEEIGEMVSTLQKLMRVRDIVLKVNRQYIKSAAQADEYRTEPHFKLQGSYRNMNKLAEKVAPIMNDEELQTLIVSHYENEAQTLTAGTEANLLKFKELMGIQTEEERIRWQDIKKTFKRNTALKGVGGDDKFAQVLVQLSLFNEGLDSIKGALEKAADQKAAEKAEEAAGPPKHYKVFLDEDALQTFRQTAGEFRAACEKLKESGRQEIEVVNKVPKAFLDVLEKQFHLMQGWMQPIFKASRAQNEEFEGLKRVLADHMQQYEILIGALEASAENEKLEKSLG